MTALAALAAVLALVGAVAPLAGQTHPDHPLVETFSVRHQPVEQVLLAFAEQSGISVVTDETVDGSVSIVLHQRDAREMIRDVAGAAQLFITETSTTIYLSRIAISSHRNGTWSLASRGASLDAVLRHLARRTGTTILPPDDRGGAIEANLGPLPLESLLSELLTPRGYTITRLGSSFSILSPGSPRYSDDPQEERGGVLWTGDEDSGVFELTATRTTRRQILETLFANSNEVFTVAGGTGEAALLAAPVDTLHARASSRTELRDQVLRILRLEALQDGLLWVVFPRETAGRLTGYTSRAVIAVARLPLGEVREILNRHEGILVEAVSTPAGIAVVRGLPGAITDALELISLLEEAQPEEMEREVIHIPVRFAVPSEVADALAREFPHLQFLHHDSLDEIIVTAPPEEASAVRQRAARWDRPVERILYHARHLPAEELLALARGDRLQRDGRETLHHHVTADGHSIVVTGTPGGVRESLDLLHLLDTPGEQLRFDLCIIQYQTSSSSHRGTAASFSRSGSTITPYHSSWSLGAEFDRLLSLQFDLISALGYQAALAISGELGTSGARLVADTSLRARNGDVARLENATTFRYRDQPETTDTTKTVIGVTREIDSGLTVELQGTLHRDRTVTVRVEVSVSKQGADLSGRGNPPPTSRRVVETTVRVAAGEPIIIGGLLQQESGRSETRMPVLGRIPVVRHLLGSFSRTSEETEMVLYLSVVPYQPGHRDELVERQLQRLRELER